MADDRYSRISLQALRRSRAMLSRAVDAPGRSTWVAELMGTGLRGSGATRTEALRRVREVAGSRRLGIAGVRRPSSPESAGSVGDSD
jgi:hypothetical protein